MQKTETQAIAEFKKLPFPHNSGPFSQMVAIYLEKIVNQEKNVKTK